MKTGKRILALLLSLSLVIGMMPGVSLTAFAEETETEEAASAETLPETTAEETEPAQTLPEETVSETTVPAETVPEETESEETAEEPAPVEVVVFNPVTKEVMGTQLASDVNYIDPDSGYDYDNPYYPTWEWNDDGTEISAFMQTEADYISFAVTVSGAMYFGDQFITNVDGTEEEPFVMTCWGPEDGSLWGLMVTVKIGQFEEEPEEEPPVAAWEYIEDEEWDTVDWETSWEEPFNPTWTYNEDGTGMSACITVTEGIDYIIYYIPQSGALYEGGWPDGDGYTDAWFYYNAEAGQTGRIKWQSDGDFSLRLTVMFGDGESGGDQPSEPDGSVTNEQYLQDQIDAGNWEIFADKEIVLENDFVIPNNVGFTVENKLTVPDGVTLTVNSGRFHIYDGGLLQVEEGGHLVIGNTISCWNGAAMNIEGTYEFSTDWGYIIVNYENGVSADQFSGIADEDMSLRFIPASEEELQEAAEIMNSADFGSYIVLVHDSLTLTEDFTIPGNCTFTISDRGSTVTIDDGVTLTNYGQLYVNPDETLHNYGTIVNNGQFSNDGTVINDGEVQNNRYLNNWGTWQGNDPVAPPMSQDDLEDALDALDPYSYYWLNNTVILERDLTIDEDQYLGIGPNGKLVVPEDITLTAGTNINVNAGGTLEIAGEFVKAHQEPWLVSVGYENDTLGNVIGIDRSEIALDYYVNMNNPDALQDAEALLEDWGFGWNFIYQWVDVTLEDDFTIPENTFLHLYGESTLTVPEGVTLTNKGELYVWENTQLVNNGTIENDMFMLVVGTMENNGTVNVNEYLVVDGPGTVQNNGDVYISGGYELYGTWEGNEPVGTALNEQYIQDKIDAGETSITLDKNIVLQNDYTVPEGIELYIEAELVVPDDVTLAINASYCHVFENGILRVEEGGHLISDVNIFGESGATVDIAGTYALAEYVTIQADYEHGAFVSTVEGVDEEDMSLQFNLHSAEELENAAIMMDESNYGQYCLDIWDDMTLTGDLTLPANCTALIELGVEVMIPKDCTITNNGNLYIMRDSTLHNYGTIVNGLIFAIEDGTFVNEGTFADMGWILNNGTWEGNEPIRGMTQEELEAALSECGGYYELTNSVTLEEDMTIDENELWIAGGSLIVPEGITLTVDSEIAVYPGGTLDVQGSVDGEGTISLLHDDRGGAGTVNGVPVEMQYLYYDVFNPDNLPGIMEELSESNFSNVMITLQSGDVTLAEDMTIPKHITLRAVNGDVTVEEGVTIDVEGQLMATIGPAIINYGRICVTGSLTVSSESDLINEGLIDISGGILKVYGPSMAFDGSKLENNGGIWCGQNGTIEMEGEFVSGEESSVSVWYHDGEMFGTINGIPTSQQDLIFDIYSEEQLIEAMEIIEEDDYKSYHAETYADITLTEDLTIPAECDFYMGYNNLTIDEDVELTIDGSFTVYSVGDNVTLVNDGIITNNSAFTVQEYATVQNNGFFVGNGTVVNNGNWYGNPAGSVNETYLQAQIDAGETEIVADIDLTFGDSFTVPEDVTLIVEEDITLTIPEGSLNVRGKLINDGIINVGGPAKQDESGWYTFWDGVFVRETGIVENNGEILCGESAWVGNYGIWEGNDAVVTPISQDVFEHNLNLNGSSYAYELDKPVVLERNMVLNTRLAINETGSLTIPQGMRLTIQSPVMVFGTIVNHHRMEVCQPVQFMDGSSYIGNGIIRVDDTSVSPLDYALQGLDLTGFEVIGGPGYWDVHNVDGLPRLGTPTDLYWENGYAHWTMTQPHERNARICLYQVGVDEPIRVSGCGWMDGDSYSFNMMDGMDLSEDASFYFTVEALSSSVGYASSEPAVSDVWTYVVPDVDMGVCTNILFDGKTVTWTGPEGSDKTTWYEVVFLHIGMTDNEPVVTFLNIGACNSNSFNIQEEWGYFYDEFGSGNYVVDVRALSNNVLEVAHGPWHSSNEVIYDGYTFRTVMNYAVLKQQIAENEAMGGMSVQLRERVVLEGDLVFPENVPLNIYEGGELIVPAGCTLTINSSSYMMQGILRVEEGGTLIINKDFWVNNSDTLEVYGEVVFGYNAYLNSAYDSDCTITGIPEERQHLHFNTETAEALKDALDFMEDNAYGKYTVNAWPPAGGWITLDFDLTIPENCEFCVGFVTIAEGVTVTNKGKIQIGDGPMLINNGTVLNYGTIDIYPEYGHWEGNAPVQVGNFGENVSWQYEEATGTMTITGTGDMYPNGTNWYKYMQEMVSLVISEGITNIPDFAFEPATKLYSVEIADSVTEIGYKAFYCCTSLESLELPENLSSISEAAFVDSGITELTFTGDAPELMAGDEYGFGGSFTNITATAYYPADNATWTEEFLCKNYGGNITWVPSTGNITPGTLTAKSGTVSLEDVIYVNFYYEYANGDLTQEYLEENGGMLIWQKADYPGDEEAVFGHEAAEVSAGLKYVESNGRYMGRTSGLPLRFLNDTLVIVGYVELPDGSYLYAPSKEYSGRIYAENRIKNIDKQADPSQKLIYERDLSIALLNSIAEAQRYFNYNVDDLANSSLSAERQKIQWSSDLLTPAATVDPNKTLARDTAVFTGRSATLSLVGKTEINFYFAIPEATKAAAVDSGILFWTEADYKNAVTLDSASATYDVEMAYFEANNRWGAAYPVGFASSEYEETVYACAYLVDSDGEYHYSGLVSYSVEQYCANQIKNSRPEAELSRNLVVYGEAAQSYFGK